MANEGNEQVGQKNDKLRGLNLRLDAAAEDQREDQIRSHPDVQVSFCPQQQNSWWLPCHFLHILSAECRLQSAHTCISTAVKCNIETNFLPSSILYLLVHLSMLCCACWTYELLWLAVQDMPEIKRWDEGSKEIIAEMLTGSMGDWAA